MPEQIDVIFGDKVEIVKQLELLKTGVIEIRKYPVCGLLKPVRESLDSMAMAITKLQELTSDVQRIWVARGTNG